MSVQPARFLCAILLLVPLAGCAEEATGTRETPVPSYTSASAGADTGGIEGRVTDDEQRPIVGAQVSAAPGDLSAVTDAEGRFSFSDLAPGAYTLAVGRLGYEAFARRVEVVVGELAQVNVTLIAIEVQEPYIDLRILDGFIKYGNAASDIFTTGNQYGCEKCRFNFTFDGSDVEAVTLEPLFKATISPPHDSARLGFQGGFGSLCVGDAVYSVPPDTAGYWASRQKIVADPEVCKWQIKKASFYLYAYCDWDWVCVDQKFQVYVSLFHSLTPAEDYSGLPPP